MLGRQGNKQRGAQGMGETSQREAGRCAIISDLVTCSGMTPSPVDTLCASQTNGLSPCSAAPFLSHRLYHPLTHTSTHTHTLTHTHITYPHKLLTQSTNTRTLHTLTHTFYSHTHTQLHIHTPSHIPHILTDILLIPLQTHTLTYSLPSHTHTHTEPTGTQTQETWGPSRSAHTPGTWSMWEQPRVPAEVSHWTFHTLGATGTLRNSLRTRETVEGLRLTQLSLDQTSQLCKISHYDQWTPHRRRTSVHSHRGSFLVKNTETVAPQIQTPFLSPQCPLSAVDPGQRGIPYLDHPPR